MKAVSLFSGAGGFDIGLERAGIEVVLQVENDPTCLSVLSRHWPNVPKITDVREVDGTQYRDIDLVCGGWPCQDLSVAGLRRGFDGERSSLFFEFARIIAEARPRWVLAENVPGLLSLPESMLAVVRTLDDLGYVGCWRVCDAQFFGVPQRRRRVFLVAGLGTLGERAAAVLLEPEGGSRHPAPRRAKGQGTARDAQGSAGGFSESGPGWWRDGVGPLRAEGENRPSRPSTLISTGGVAGGETARYGKGTDSDATDTLLIAAPLTAGGHPNSNMPGRHKEDDENLVAFQWQAGGDASQSMAMLEDGSPTLGTSQTPAVSGKGLAVRRLMPIECERLQGWEDGWTEFGADGKPLPDSARYRLIGNGVAAPVAEWIGRHLLEVAS